jgi:uncharacterized membrane protein
VTSDANPPGGRRSLATGRLTAFSDGVFSIAATLLVLDLAVHPPGTPLEQVLRAWPAYLAYVVSFLTIGGAWLAHTAMTDRLARSDLNFLRLNLLVLLVVAFLPFPTSLVTEALRTGEGQNVAVTIYGMTLLAIHVLGAALKAYARHAHLDAPEDREMKGTHRRLLPVVIGYVIAILAGLAVPTAAVALYFGLATYLIVPLHQITRVVFRR